MTKGKCHPCVLEGKEKMRGLLSLGSLSPWLMRKVSWLELFIEDMFRDIKKKKVALKKS
jgi:hypothetical protein